MERQLVLEETLMVKLEPELKRRLKVEAARQGTDMSKITRKLLLAHLDEVGRTRQSPETHGENLVDRIRGRATSGLTTDEIMALTRS